MGNKLYVTKVPTQTLKSCTDNTVICQEDFSCGYESSSRSSKAAKAPAKEEKNNIFQIFKKASVLQLALFFAFIIFVMAKRTNLLSIS
jgi:uncharacterized membrane protein YvbJ